MFILFHIQGVNPLSGFPFVQRSQQYFLNNITASPIRNSSYYFPRIYDSLDYFNQGITDYALPPVFSYGLYSNNPFFCGSQNVRFTPSHINSFCNLPLGNLGLFSNQPYIYPDNFTGSIQQNCMPFDLMDYFSYIANAGLTREGFPPLLFEADTDEAAYSVCCSPKLRNNANYFFKNYPKSVATAELVIVTRIQEQEEILLCLHK